MSARLSVSASEVEKLMPRPRSERSADSAPARSAVAMPPRHDVAVLCLLALRDEAARKFLLEQNWREVLPQISGTEMLARILESELRPDDPVSVNSFMSQLTA